MIPDPGHFKPVKPALGAATEASETFHHPVLVRVLLEADRQIRGIRVLHEVGLFLVQAHEAEQDTQSDDSGFIHGHDQGFVGTPELLLEVLPDRLLGGAGGGMLVEGESKGLELSDLPGTTGRGSSKINLEDLYEMGDTAFEVFVDR